jgi:hypothetical protein
MKRTIYLGVLLLLSLTSQAQTTGAAWYLSVQGNLFVPGKESARGMYPILAYDKETDPKLLVGGFGAGAMRVQHLNEKNELRLQAGLFKHTYWDESLALQTPRGYVIGPFYRGGSDYGLSLSGTLHHFLSRRVSIGTGVGARALLVSLTRLPEYEDNASVQPVRGVVGVTRYYKKVQPYIPLELSYHRPNTRYTLRYEQGLLNSLRGDLAKYKTDRYGMLVFEMGFGLR